METEKQKNDSQVISEILAVHYDIKNLNQVSQFGILNIPELKSHHIGMLYATNDDVYGSVGAMLIEHKNTPDWVLFDMGYSRDRNGDVKRGYSNEEARIKISDNDIPYVPQKIVDYQKSNAYQKAQNLINCKIAEDKTYKRKQIIGHAKLFARECSKKPKTMLNYKIKKNGHFSNYVTAADCSHLLSMSMNIDRKESEGVQKIKYSMLHQTAGAKPRGKILAESIYGMMRLITPNYIDDYQALTIRSFNIHYVGIINEVRNLLNDGKEKECYEVLNNLRQTSDKERCKIGFELSKKCFQFIDCYNLMVKQGKDTSYSFDR